MLTMARWQIRDNAQACGTVSGWVSIRTGGHNVPFAILCTYMTIAGQTVSADVPKNHVHTYILRKFNDGRKEELHDFPLSWPPGCPSHPGISLLVTVRRLSQAAPLASGLKPPLPWHCNTRKRTWLPLLFAYIYLVFILDLFFALRRLRS